MRRLQLPSRQPGDPTTQALLPRVQPPGARPPDVKRPGVKRPRVQPPGVQPPGVQPPGASLATRSAPQSLAPSPPAVVPATAKIPATRARPPRKRQRSLKWRLIAIAAVLLTALATLGLNTAQALQEQEVTSPDGPAAALLQPLIGGTPVPSGHAPTTWGTQAAAAIVVQKSRSNQLCDDPITWPANIDNWTVPPGCYGNVYKPNPANYPSRPGFGWCNWWVRVNHPDEPDITENKSYPSGSVPHPGNAVFFYGNVQGADSAGHWAQVVAVSPDGYWVLISEMNFAWRGAGWARIDFRYIHVGNGVVFIYAP